jgi:O-antigen/teichoic acid export membrane protein
VADQPDDGLTGLGRRSALALVGAGVSGVATIATLIIASRTLSGVGAGEFFVAISLFAVVQGVCSFGVETGLQYFVPTMAEPAARRLIWIVSAASTVSGLVVAAVVWVLAGPFGDLLGKGEATSGDTAHVVRTIAVLLPFAGLYEVVMGALRACDQVLISTVLDRIMRPIAQVVAMLVVASTSAGSQGVVLAWAVPNAAAVILAVLLLPRVRLRNAAQRTEHVSQARFWRYTAPRSVARIAQTLTQRLDVLILAAVYPLEDAAVYGTVSRCMIAGVFVASALRQTVQPQLRRLIVRGDRTAVKNMYGASTTWLLLVTWPVYLAMITHAPLVMSVFGADYVRGAPALVLLCLAMLVASACGLVDVVLLMLGRSWLSTLNVLIALVLNVVLNLVLAPAIGMIGSAIAWVVAILATNLLPLAQTAREGLHPGGPPLATAMVLSVSTIAAPLTLERIVFGSALTPFLIVSAIALVAYAVALRRFRHRVLLDRLVSDLRRPRRVAAGR